MFPLGTMGRYVDISNYKSFPVRIILQHKYECKNSEAEQTSQIQAEIEIMYEIYQIRQHFDPK